MTGGEADVVGFTDLREGEDSAHTPFFDSVENRLRKDAPAGCAYATAGFPPSWCRHRPAYQAVFYDDYMGRSLGGTWWLCPEHAERARTLTGWMRVAELRTLGPAPRLRADGDH